MVSLFVPCSLPATKVILTNTSFYKAVKFFLSLQIFIYGKFTFSVLTNCLTPISSVICLAKYLMYQVSKDARSVSELSLLYSTGVSVSVTVPVFLCINFCSFLITLDFCWDKSHHLLHLLPQEYLGYFSPLVPHINFAECKNPSGTFFRIALKL